jgi:hypothetical protein
MWWPFGRGSGDSAETRAALIEQLRWVQGAYESERAEKEFYRDQLLRGMGVVDATYPPHTPAAMGKGEGVPVKEEGKVVGQHVSINSLRARAEIRRKKEADDAKRGEGSVQPPGKQAS